VSNKTTSLLDKAKAFSGNKSKPPKTQKPKTTDKKTKPQSKSSKEVTMLRDRLRKSEYIMALVEGLLVQLFPTYEIKTDKNGNEIRVKDGGWAKFDPTGKNGSQGRAMETILKEINEYKKL